MLTATRCIMKVTVYTAARAGAPALAAPGEAEDLLIKTITIIITNNNNDNNTAPARRRWRLPAKLRTAWRSGLGL